MGNHARERDHLARPVRPVFNATGVVRGSVKYPKLGEGDATAIVSAAGLDDLEDDDLEDQVIDTEAAISHHLSNLDSSAGRGELQDSRETRDGMIEEFITALRKRLLPEAVAAEEAQMERLYPPISRPRPGLDDGFPGPAGPEETTGQTP